VATPEAGAVEIAIEAIGVRFSPSAITIPARTPVRLVLTNRSRVYHDLVIPKLGRRTRRIGPDDVAELLIVAEPGDYDFYCSIPSHTQAGMGGVITAVAA
jgi:nitrite reductase (NO-forming)